MLRRPLAAATPPCPKIGVTCPQFGQQKVDMFSISPSTGVEYSEEDKLELARSSSAAFHSRFSSSLLLFAGMQVPTLSMEDRENFTSPCNNYTCNFKEYIFSLTLYI